MGNQQYRADEGADERAEAAEYIPAQQVGNESDVANCTDYGDETQAKQAFVEARARMLDVNNWFGLMTAAAPGRTLGGLNPLIPTFSLLDPSGSDKQGTATSGDLIKISAAGQDMYVSIETIIEQADEFALQVRPCRADGPNDSEACESEHVYTDAATNTFRLTRSGTTLTTGFHGRNEVTHDDLVSKAVDTGLSLGGRQLSWHLLGKAWRPEG